MSQEEKSCAGKVLNSASDCPGPVIYSLTLHYRADVNLNAPAAFFFDLQGFGLCEEHARWLDSVVGFVLELTLAQGAEVPDEGRLWGVVFSKGLKPPGCPPLSFERPELSE